MKIKNTQLTILALFTIMGLAFIYGCKKEDPLKPNPDMEIYQNENYAGGDDFFGDTTGTGGGTDTTGGGGGTDTTGGGGGTAPNPYFRADADGVTENFPSRSYTSTSLGVVISASQGGSSVKQISFSLISQPVEGDTIDLGMGQATYMKGLGLTYPSKSGYLVFDKIESAYVQGTFSYVGESPSNPSDTVVISNGEFSINR